MRKYIFVSYTLRDGGLTVDLLKKFKQSFAFLGVETYVDILDNANPINPQAYVIDKLINASEVWLLETSSTYMSEWVMAELMMASKWYKKVRRMRVNARKTLNYVFEDLKNLTIS